MNNSNPTETWKTGNYIKNGGRSGNNFHKSDQTLRNVLTFQGKSDFSFKKLGN